MKKVFVLGMSVMLLWSCNNTTEKATEKQETETHAEQQHDENSEAIELNNGEKWMVNEEMKPFVMKGEELVNSFIQNNQADYKALAQQLKEQNDQLIKSCTMDGKSHDELHKWLLPFIDLSENFKNSKTLQEYATHFEEIKTTFIHFNTYFK